MMDTLNAAYRVEQTRSARPCLLLSVRALAGKDFLHSRSLCLNSSRLPLGLQYNLHLAKTLGYVMRSRRNCLLDKRKIELLKN